MMLIALAPAHTSPPPGETCIYDKGENVLQGELPTAISVDLSMRAPDLSPAGGPFQASDVGEGPRARFKAAARLGDRYVVAYERGGRGYNIQVLTYVLTSYGLAPLVSQQAIFDKPVCGVIAAALTSP